MNHFGFRRSTLRKGKAFRPYGKGKLVRYASKNIHFSGYEHKQGGNKQIFLHNLGICQTLRTCCPKGIRTTYQPFKGLQKASKRCKK